MKPLLLIIVCCCTGLAQAQQHFSKKKVNAGTGDTMQYTREWIIADPFLKNLALGQEGAVYWGFQRLKAKNHRADTLLLCLDFTGESLIPPKYHGRITTSLIPTSGNNDLQVTFTNRDSLCLSLRSAGFTPYDGYALYVLSPKVIREMTNRQISTIKVSTTAGPVTYKLRTKRALNIQKQMGLVAAPK